MDLKIKGIENIVPIYILKKIRFQIITLILSFIIVTVIYIIVKSTYQTEPTPINITTTDAQFKSNPSNANIQINPNTPCIILYESGKFEVLPYSKTQNLKFNNIKKIKIITESEPIEIVTTTASESP